MINVETEAPKESEVETMTTRVVEKQTSSYFDIGKARQTIYSILMGFVLKYFIENVYENHEIIASLELKYLFAYICILSYFFLNCFRFLFALVDYSNMTDEKFAPQNEDWKWSNFVKNTGKLFVINTGVFQLIIFGFSVFFLFPHLDPSVEDKNVEFIKTMPTIVLAFGISTLLLLVIDLRSLHLFKKHVVGKDFEPRERAQHNIWRWGDWIELLISGLLLASLYHTSPNCVNNWQTAFILILTLSAIMESIALYRYLELPVMSFSLLINNLQEGYKKWKKRDNSNEEIKSK